MNYFNELLDINKKIMNDEDVVRITDLSDIYRLLDDFYSKNFNLDSFIKLCIKLFNIQIFYDGNTRTILAYIAKVIDKYGYSFDYERATEGLVILNGLFPVLYDLDEEINEKEVNKIKQFIDLKDKRKGR